MAEETNNDSSGLNKYNVMLSNEEKRQLAKVQEYYRAQSLAHGLRLMLIDVVDLIGSGDWEGIESKLNSKRQEIT